MKVLETRIYRGPSLSALWPVIRLRLDLGELEWFPTVKLPGFAARLVELIPTLAEHTCSYGEPGGFVRRMNEDEGTWLGHVLEHVALELQCLVGTPVTFGKTRSHGLPRGQYHVVYSFCEESVVVDAEEAVEEADWLGYPVVVKPLDGSHGHAVATGLKTADEVRAAFGNALEESCGVIVETFQTGNDYRILVVGGKVVAAAQRVPGHVVGDGLHSVRELV